MKAALLAFLFVSLIPSILAAAGGWRFAHGAFDLGEVTVATNLTNTTASLKPGDVLPDSSYFPAATGTVLVTLSGGNLQNPIVQPVALTAGYSTVVVGGSEPTFKVFSDAIESAQKSIGGSNFAAIRLINAANYSVTLKYNGTGYSENLIATADGFLDASDYQRVPSGDADGLFFVVDDATGGVLAEAAGTLDIEAVYTAFFTESTDAGVTHLKLKLLQDQPSITVAYVRTVHAVPDLKAEIDVDILYSVDANTTVAANVSYFTVSDYVATQPGNNEVLLRPHEGNVSSTNFPFANLANYTVLVVGFANDTQIQVVSDDLQQAVNTSARVRFVNLIPNAPVVTISVTDSSNSSNVVARNSTTLFIDSEVYMSVNGASTVKAVILGGKGAPSLDYTFEKNTVYTVWVYGFASKPQIDVTQDYPAPPTAKGLSNLELGLIIAGAIMFVILLLAIIIFAVRSRPAEGYERIEN